MDEDNKLLLTVPEAAKRLGVSRAYLYKLVGSGEILTLKLGRLRRVPVFALEEFVAQRAKEAGY